SRRLAAVSPASESILVYELESSKAVRKLPLKAYALSSVRFSPDAKHLAGGDRDGVIHIWELSSGREVQTLQPLVSSLPYEFAYSPDGKRLVSLHYKERVLITLDVAQGTVVWRVTFPQVSTMTLSLA